MRHRDRISLTLQCHDCDYIPKVEGAGGIFRNSDGIEYQLMHNGIKVIKDCYHPFITEIIKGLRGHHEPQEEKLFHEVLRRVPENSVMIELGSSWAYYSLWFQKEIHQAVNYMIEPNIEKLRAGRANFELNRFENGHFFHGCAEDAYAQRASFQDWDGTLHQIEAWTVDEFLLRNKVRHVAILHSDIQGAEVRMLHGAERSLSDRKIDHIFISTHGDSCHKGSLDLLTRYQYAILCSHTSEESFSGDGLIVASAVLQKDGIDSAISLRSHRNERDIGGPEDRGPWKRLRDEIRKVPVSISRIMRRLKTRSRSR